MESDYNKFFENNVLIIKKNPSKLLIAKTRPRPNHLNKQLMEKG